MSAYRIPCRSDVGQKLLDDRAEQEFAEEAAQRDLDDMAESDFWLRKWGREDDSEEAIHASARLAMLLLGRDLPNGTSERADKLRDAYESLREELRGCFDRWASGSHLARYQEAERIARETDRADDVEDGA